MGSKWRRKKQQHARKREKRKAVARRQKSERRPEVMFASNARHRERLAQQVPAAWPGELREDAAVFDDLVLAALPPEAAHQVTLVREALQDACASRGDEALNRVSAISRASSLSEWRLFIRGLVEWLADHANAAEEAWKRLDPERRPGRIATAMMVSRRSDLENLPARQEPQAVESATSEWDYGDDQLLYHAKLLRRVRFDRGALRVADAGVKALEEAKELRLGPKKLDWIRRFVAEYEGTEPDLSIALAQTALHRAFAQDFSDIFDDAIRSFPGPRHDRRNRLLTYYYYSRYPDASAEKKAAQALNDYLNRDLAQNESLSAPLRRAIVSQIHLCEARVLIQPGRSGGRGLVELLRVPSQEQQAIRDHLLAAVKAEPTNVQAYQAHVEWIESELDDERLANNKRPALEKELADVMRHWSKGVPEAVEPRLWLVDHLLEEEQLEEARPHVDFLAASRHDDPRVRATPWKWQLLEAMRLCRRKAWLPEVPARLEEAETLWPAWLSRQWSPYLRAAWLLRTGQTEAFEERRRQICLESGVARDSLADACMMLGAAQRMRVVPSGLKPFRDAVDQAMSQLETLPLEDLIETGSFFWDLHRVRLVYPAYRSHGKNIGTALFARLAKATESIRFDLDGPLHKAILWGSEYRFWSGKYDTKLPSFFSQPALERHPIFVAAQLNAVLKERFHWDLGKHKKLGPWMREAIQSERDAYFRYWFTELADRWEELLARKSARFAGFPFGDLFGSEDEGGEDEDNDDEDGDDEDRDDEEGNFDPDCDCARCRAARAAAEKAGTFDAIPF
jgi:hypothetical protein